MLLSNRAPVNAAGQLMVTTAVPTAAWPSLGGMTYHPTTGELAVIDSVPVASDPWDGGIRFTPLGAMYVISTLPSPLFYVGGIAVSTDGRVYMTVAPPTLVVGGWPVAGDGSIAGIGLTPPSPPTVVTTAATNVTFIEATLNGTVTANGFDIWFTSFEWGLTTAYGNTVGGLPNSGSPSAVNLPFNAPIAPLAPSTTYHYRAIAENVNGVGYGADMTFTTGAAAGEFFASFITSLIPKRSGGNPTPSFTRATSAFAQNSEGILRISEVGEARFRGSRRVENYIRDSQNPATVNWTNTGSTITTGVTGPTGLPDAWTVTATAASAMCRGSGVAFFARGAKLRNSVWLRRRTGTGAVTGPSAVGGSVPYSNLTTAWQRFTSTVVAAGADTVSVFAGIVVGTVGDQVDMAYPQAERVEMRANQSPSEYVGTGVLTAPWYGSGVDTIKNFDTMLGNSVPNNLLRFSQELSTIGAWTSGSVVTTPGAQIAPDGTMTGYAITDTTSNSTHAIAALGWGPFLSPGQFHTLSIYAKAGTITWLKVSMGSPATERWVNFNLATGAMGLTQGAGGTIQAVNNGWYRLSVTANMTADPAEQPDFVLMLGDTPGMVPPYVGSGQTLYLWGAQLENGNAPSAYSKTTDTTYPGNIVVEALGPPLSQDATNLFMQSQDFVSAPTWTPYGSLFTPNAAAAPDGTMTATLMTEDLANTGHRCYQFTPVLSSAFHTISMYFKANVGSPWVQLVFYDGTFCWANFNVATGVIGNYGSEYGTLTPKIVAVGNGWFRCAITFAGRNGAGNFGPYLIPSDITQTNYAFQGTGSSVYMWGAQWEKSPNLSPYVRTGAAPSYAMLGCLQENAATNLVRQSQTFEAADWVKNDSTITANTQTAPDGTLTADTFTDNAVSAIHRVIQGPLAIASGPYTYSVYLKAGTLSWARPYVDDGITAVWANFNLVNGTVGVKSPAGSASVQALPNGWFRCSLTMTSAGTAGLCLVDSLNGDMPGSNVYAGTGQTMFLWGTQVEVGPAATSYIPTTTAVVTRAADAVQFAMLNNLSGGTATTYAEIFLPYSTPSTRVILRSTGPPIGTPLYVLGGLDAASIHAQGVQQVATGGNAMYVGNDAVNRIACAYSGTTADICANGNTVASGGGVTAPFYPSTGNFVVGAAPDAPGASLQGTIRNVEFFSTRKTPAELQAMTVVPLPQPTFYTPLVDLVYPSIAGGSVQPVLTRATSATVTAVPAGNSAAQGLGVVAVVANEVRFWGARRYAVNSCVTTYANGVDWIPPASLLGYLSENASTNGCLQSGTLNVAPWQLTGNVTYEVNPANAAPDGSLTAWVVKDNTANNFHLTWQPFPSTAQSFTLSIYAQAAGITWLQLTLATTTPPVQNWANFNLTTGAVGSKAAGVTATSVQPLGSGWFRLSITATLAADPAAFLVFALIKSDVPSYAPVYVGDGSWVNLWGPQLEYSYLTSYIPTGAAATTRNMDVLTYDVPGNFVGNSNNNSGAVAAEYYLTAPAVGLFQSQLRYTGGGSPLFIYNTKEQMILNSAGGGGGTANKPVVGQISKAASMWSGTTGTNGAVVLNGGAVAVVILGSTLYPSTGSMWVGTTTSDGQNLVGTIKQIRFYNTRLSTAQLQGLTQ